MPLAFRLVNFRGAELPRRVSEEKVGQDKAQQAENRHNLYRHTVGLLDRLRHSSARPLFVAAGDLDIALTNTSILERRNLGLGLG